MSPEPTRFDLVQGTRVILRGIDEKVDGAYRVLNATPGSIELVAAVTVELVWDNPNDPEPTTIEEKS